MPSTPVDARAVEHVGDRVRGAGRRLQHDEVARRVDRDEELRTAASAAATRRRARWCRSASRTGGGRPRRGCGPDRAPRGRARSSTASPRTRARRGAPGSRAGSTGARFGPARSGPAAVRASRRSPPRVRTRPPGTPPGRPPPACSVTFNGGEMPDHVRARLGRQERRAPSAARTTAPATGRSNATPISRPAPRTVASRPAARIPCVSWAPRSRQFASSPSCLDHVEHRERRARTGSARRRTSRRAPRRRTRAPRRRCTRRSAARRRAPSPRDDVRREARDRLEGEPLPGPADTGLHLVEHQQRAAFGAQLARGARYAWSSGTTPPSPRIGSISTAAVCAPTAAVQRRRRRPAARGRTPRRAVRTAPAWPAARSPRAWRTSARGTTPPARRRRVRPAAFPCLRAIFSAASFASAPEFAKNTVDGNPASAVSRPASSSCGPVDHRFETWAGVAACVGDRRDPPRVRVADRRRPRCRRRSRGTRCRRRPRPSTPRPGRASAGIGRTSA